MKNRFISSCILAVIIVLSSVASNAENYEVAKYKLRSDANAFYLLKDGNTDFNKSYSAGDGSKFYIYKNEENNPQLNGYVIKFTKIKKSQCVNANGCESVSDEEFYTFYDKVDQAKNNRTVKSYYFRKSLAIDHGLLVIPFKFRTNDGSLTGESSIGYYVGVKTEFSMVSFVPFISAGLSRIAINDVNNEVDYRTGLTAAAGLVLADTNNFQVALVSGIDHLGGNAGDNWEYENDPWVSFAIGYNFATSK